MPRLTRKEMMNRRVPKAEAHRREEERIARLKELEHELRLERLYEILSQVKPSTDDSWTRLLDDDERPHAA
jgi:hypothetical protein